MEYYLALKKKEILTSATWINLEDITLNEISQPQKDKYYMVPLIWSTYSSQIQRDRK